MSVQELAHALDTESDQLHTKNSFRNQGTLSEMINYSVLVCGQVRGKHFRGRDTFLQHIIAINKLILHVLRARDSLRLQKTPSDSIELSERALDVV